MRKLNIIVTLVTSIMIFGCKKANDSDVCFSKNREEIMLGQLVKFDNCSKNVDHVEWDFGDGHGSELVHPTHHYERAGNFTVTLYATDEKSEELISSTEEINVKRLKLTHIIVNDIFEGYHRNIWIRDLQNNYTIGSFNNAYSHRKIENGVKTAIDNSYFLNNEMIGIVYEEFAQPSQPSEQDYHAIINFNPYELIDLEIKIIEKTTADGVLNVKLFFELE